MVCGDSAVVLMLDQVYYGAGQIGFGTDHVRVVMPVSPDAFVICGFTDPTRLREQLAFWNSDEFASFVNRATLDHASRFVFGADARHIERARADLAASAIA